MKDIRQQCVDEQDKAAQIFTWCMVVAMHQEEGIGATRLNRACNVRCGHFKPATKVKSTLGIGGRPLKLCGTF